MTLTEVLIAVVAYMILLYVAFRGINHHKHKNDMAYLKEREAYDTRMMERLKEHNEFVAGLAKDMSNNDKEPWQRNEDDE